MKILTQNLDDTPLYNSRITQTYVNYIRHVYPTLDFDQLLKKAAITTEEVADKGHWFNDILTFSDDALEVASKRKT